MAFEREMETYRARLPELLPHEGDFVVIRGDEVIGIHPTWEHALQAGYQRCGLEPFMVKEIAAVERVHHV